MRVLLISANREDVDIRVPALGLACITAAVRNSGHETHLLDLMVTRNPQDAVGVAINNFQPEVIGISVRNIDDQRMRNTRFLLDQARDAVCWCRNHTQVPIVAGGAGFSILPQPILKYLSADMGIQGEGEMVFPELLKRIEAGENIGELPGLHESGKPAPARRSFSRDLDSFPLPDPSLLEHSLSSAHDAPVPVQTRRGCPLSCSYCSTPTIEGCSVRWRSPESIVAWMARWVDEGFRNFYFVDNAFNLPPSYATSLCTKIIAAGLDISWRCILFPGGLDRKLIELLARAGCKEASLGFESGAKSILKSMNKQFRLEDVARASELLKDAGIRRMGFLLLGAPGETEDTVEESLRFAESLQLDYLRISIGIRIYPNTEIAHTAEREGLISSDQDLLFPKFYIARHLEDWLYEKAEAHVHANENWTF